MKSRDDRNWTAGMKQEGGGRTGLGGSEEETLKSAAMRRWRSLTESKLDKAARSGSSGLTCTNQLRQQIFVTDSRFGPTSHAGCIGGGRGQQRGVNEDEHDELILFPHKNALFHHHRFSTHFFSMKMAQF